MQGYEGRPGTPGGCGIMGTCVSRGFLFCFFCKLNKNTLLVIGFFQTKKYPLPHVEDIIFFVGH